MASRIEVGRAGPLRTLRDLLRVLRHMRRPLITVFVPVLSAVLVVGCASLVRPNYSQTLTALRPGAYTLDPEHAYVHFRIEHLGLSTVVGSFNRVRASLDFDPQAISELNLAGVVDVTSIDLNNQDLETRLQGSDWFDTAQFPEAVFRTVKVTPGQGNRFVIEGEFTLHGVTRPMLLDASFKGGADNLLSGKYTLGFAADTSFRRSDYEIDSLGALVADVVFVEINGEFQAAD